jgi:serine/threonine protein kinase
MALNLKTETVFTGEPAAAVSPPPSPDQLAQHFPQLEILEYLGRGGMGLVYKARQKSLNRFVALKLLAPERLNDPQFAARFEKEARALAALNHPNIVAIYDFGVVPAPEGRAGSPLPASSASQLSTLNSQPPLYYFLMEFVDGVNLRQLLQGERVSAREALAIVPQICDALQYAHDQGIVHRDIKPENILMDRRGRAKVADFGLAKIVGDVGQTFLSAGAGDFPVAGSEKGNTGLESPVNRQAGKPALQPDLTDAGKIMGTPQYMSPEQIEAPGEVDHRADIYALGVVLYQMLTGELPGKKLEPPSKKVQIDVRLDEVVLRALEQKPERRYQQASVLKTQIETIVSEMGGADIPPAEPGVPPGSRETQGLWAWLTRPFSPAVMWTWRLVIIALVVLFLFFAKAGFQPTVLFFVVGIIAGVGWMLQRVLMAKSKRPHSAPGGSGRESAPSKSEETSQSRFRSAAAKHEERFPGKAIAIGSGALALVLFIAAAWNISNRRAAEQKQLARGALQMELGNKIATLLGNKRLVTYSSFTFEHVPNTPWEAVVHFRNLQSWRDPYFQPLAQPRKINGDLVLDFQPPNEWAASGRGDLYGLGDVWHAATPGFPEWLDSATDTAGMPREIADKELEIAKKKFQSEVLSQAGKNLSASNLVELSRLAYATVRTYRDAGWTVHGYGTDAWTNHFTQLLSRDKRYNIRIVTAAHPFSNTNLWWSDGETEFWQYLAPVISKNSQPATETCNLSQVTSDSTVPALFYNLNWGNILATLKFSSPAELVRLQDEAVSGVDCYVLEKAAAGMKVWLGKEDFLIRRYRQFISKSVAAEALKSLGRTNSAPFEDTINTETFEHIAINERLSNDDFLPVLPGIQVQMQPLSAAAVADKWLAERAARDEFQLRWVAAEGDTNSPADVLPDASNTTSQRTFRVLHDVVLSSIDVDSAGFSQYQSEQKSLEIFLSPRGREKFAQATAQNIGRQLAIVWRGKVISAPVVRSEIPGGRVQITGRFTDAEAQQLLDLLNGRATAKQTNEVSAALSQPPKLQFLAWQDSKASAAWHPDGSPVTDATEWDSIRHNDTASMGDFSRWNLSLKPRFLDLWFSHPLFDHGSFAEITLLDDQNTVLPFNMPASSIGTKSDGLGWCQQALNMNLEPTNLPAHLTVRLCYAVGPLENLVGVPVKPTSTAETNELHWGWSIINIGQNVDGKAFITLGIEGSRMQGRRIGVAAVAKDGRELKVFGGGCGSYLAAGRSVEGFSVDVPLTNVAKFLIGTRPIRTNEWKNVVLPGSSPAPALPKSVQFRWVAAEGETNSPADILPTVSDQPVEPQVRVLRDVILTERDVERARLQTNGYSQYGSDNKRILLFLTDAGARKFGEAPAQNIGRQLAIVWRGKAIFARKIPGNRVVTNGRFTDAEAQQFLDVLNHRAPQASQTNELSNAPSQPPRLQFLAWQDEWQTNRPAAARHPDGSPVTNANELDWLRLVGSGGVLWNRPGPVPRFLHLWFSHPQFDRTCLNDVTLLDDQNKIIPPGGGGSFCLASSDASAENGNLGWQVKTLSPGEGANLPQRVNVRLCYTAGPLENGLEVELKPGTHTVMALEGGSQLNGMGQNVDGKAFVSIAVNNAGLHGRKFGALAVTKDGRRLTPGGAGVGGLASSLTAEEFTFDVPLTSIAKFLIGTRPIRTNEWKNVVLPGNSTNDTNSKQSDADPYAEARRNACISNLEAIDAAMQQCVLENNLGMSSVLTADQISPYLRNGKMPECPSGGTYSFGLVTKAPTCSIPGHALEANPPVRTQAPPGR